MRDGTSPAILASRVVPPTERGGLAHRMQSVIGMSILRVVSPYESPVRSTPGTATPPRALRRWLLFAVACCASAAACMLMWWMSNAVTREVRALPDAQRIPLYQRTIQNLKSVCDPAAPRSLRDFCNKEADLALRFRECDSDPQCDELARRHLPHPYR